jgi:hypothetical protein
MKNSITIILIILSMLFGALLGSYLEHNHPFSQHKSEKIMYGVKDKIVSINYKDSDPNNTSDLKCRVFQR